MTTPATQATAPGHGHPANIAISLLHLAGITEINRTLQRITRDRARACSSSPHETQITNDFADPVPGPTAVIAVAGGQVALHDEPVKDWIDRLSIWKFSLIMWTGSALCVLLGIATAMSLSGSRFNLGLFIWLGVVIPLVSLPGIIRRRKRRRSNHRDPCHSRN